MGDVISGGNVPARHKRPKRYSVQGLAACSSERLPRAMCKDLSTCLGSMLEEKIQGMLRMVSFYTLAFLFRGSLVRSSFRIYFISTQFKIDENTRIDSVCRVVVSLCCRNVIFLKI